MKYFLTIIIIALAASAFGQNNFTGILLNKQDSMPIQFAIIKSTDINNFTRTDDKGEFSFQIPAKFTKLHFQISAIGLHDTISIHRNHNAKEKIYVDKKPLALDSFNVKGLSAIEIMRKAVEMIPFNYTDSSFASFSFYRQYHKVNDTFKNLVEAQAVIYFKVTPSNKKLTSTYAFDIEQMRRSNFTYDIEDNKYYQNEIASHLSEDPIYNLEKGALNPNAFIFYKFNFDTTSKSDDYVIKYTSLNFSSESHGVENYAELGWFGEAWEEGKFTIDRKSFAIKKTERRAYRNTKFDYPRNNNFIIPSRAYYMEFIDGSQVAEYEQVKGKWFLKTLYHSFTNEYFDSYTTKKAYSLTENFEWYSDSVSHFVSTGLADKFYDKTSLPTCAYVYDKSYWDKILPPFYFVKKEDVYIDLEKKSSVEEQFENSGK